MMNVVNIDGPPRYLIRPSRDDHKLIERLLSGELWRSQSIVLDGIVLDAAHADRLGQPLTKNPLKEALADKPVQIIVDPQNYRLVDGYSRVTSLLELPYSPRALLDRLDGAGYTPDDFSGSEAVKRFVKSVLDHQKSLGATDYVAPAFFVGAEDSPWIDVNRRVLDECVSQAGKFVYATACGTLAGVTHEWCAETFRTPGLAGAYVLVSPLDPRHDGISKLLHYLELLASFRALGLNVVAARQPAFGLTLMALGIAGFDSGIAQAEQFDFPTLIRAPRSSGGKRKGGGRSRRVYLKQLMTPLQVDIARHILQTPSLRGHFSCSQACCRDNLSDAVLASREHFIWSRLDEVAEMRALSMPARVRYLAERLQTARQLAKKVRRAMPDETIRFDHLDVWHEVLEVAASVKQREAG